ncbi:MAG TPA: aminotransferase class I/II-fold pyridoxal phosphate-dependent enzyme, partial [Baekduia sp.]|nr:aminotransferase class I/II-fold pyridoxal phosphate-dependent enzyme [Baekduia sp.]
TFFLWMTTPIADEQQFAFDLIEKGIVCAPGSMFGPYGKGHLRVALVPTPADCERAAQILTA